MAFIVTSLLVSGEGKKMRLSKFLLDKDIIYHKRKKRNRLTFSHCENSAYEFKLGREIEFGKKYNQNYLREIFPNRFVLTLSFFATIEAFYLFYSKFQNSGLVCSVGTCSLVLDSPFSNFLEIPISFCGFLLYSQIPLFFLKNFDTKSKIKDILDRYYQIFFGIFLVFFGIFEVYFSIVMEFILAMPCEWCLIFLILNIGLLTNFFLKQQKVKTKKNKLIFFLLLLTLIIQYLGNMVEMEYLLK